MAINRLDEVKIEEGVNNLFKLFENRKDISKTLLSQKEQIYLQVDFVKIPRMRKTIFRIPLPNSLLTETSDVCLIVADVKRGRNVPHNMTINHYTKLLKKRGVTDVQKLNILPSRQVRVDYVQYEARRKLCSNYDIFLIDEKISSYLFPKLGKEFTKSRKWPIPIKIKKKNLKDEILSKLKKTSLLIDGTGNSKTLQIGHLGMSPKEIAENIISTGFYIMKYFPGGWNNIRSLHIKGQRTPVVPLYMSLISPNDVPVPKIKGKKKKSVIAVGEVSSAGRKVTVRRSGDVIVHDFSSEEDSEDEYEIENSDSDEELVTSVEKKRKQPDDEAEEEKKDGVSSDEDEEICEDDMESKYLFHLQKEDEESEKREKESQQNSEQKDQKVEMPKLKK
ncbi:hypothetical protein V9T40_012247 [Parthenolecanium corni]|uniref:Ribosomal protein L1 n=1 Tax=Parthenolecanium corni TaxID=536013 RepID=A0AAN9TMT1_9HEMI